MEMQNDNKNVSFVMEPDEFKPESLVDFRQGQCAIVGSLIFFYCVNLVVCRLEKPKSVKLKEEEVWRWTNLVVSCVHAFITGLWDLSVFMLYPEMVGDLLNYINNYMYILIGVTTGYFIFDVLDMAVNNKLFKLWEISIHHFVVITMFYLNMYRESCISFSCVALIAEVNSFFLHLRKILQMKDFKFDNRFYKLVCLVNLITFVIFRGISIISINISLYFWRDKVSTAYYLTLFVSMVFMNIMNPVLFWRLLKSDFLRSSVKPKVKVTDEMSAVLQNGNNNIPHVNNLHGKTE